MWGNAVVGGAAVVGGLLGVCGTCVFITLNERRSEGHRSVVVCNSGSAKQSVAKQERMQQPDTTGTQQSEFFQVRSHGSLPLPQSVS